MDTATLQLAGPQLYIPVAILVAISTIVSADLRDREKLLPKARTDTMAILLVSSSLVGLSHIFMVMLVKNDLAEAPGFVVVDFIVHTMMLAAIAVLVCIWYSAIASFKETPAGLPEHPGEHE